MYIVHVHVPSLHTFHVLSLYTEHVLPLYIVYVLTLCPTKYMRKPQVHVDYTANTGKIITDHEQDSINILCACLMYC